MSFPRARVLTILAAALVALVASSPARADTVTDWNQQATDTLIGPAPQGLGQGPTVAVLHLAMVQGAVYDAVNAIEPRHEAYLGAPEALSSYSKDVAAATAAYEVLRSIVPSTQQAASDALDTRYAASLGSIPNGPAKAGGIAVGHAAAQQMILARTGDGRFGPFRFPVGTEPGAWRPLLPAFLNDPAAWVAQVKPFLVPDPAAFRSHGPSALKSDRYAEEFAEVKSLGSNAENSPRTADQTDMARFWAEHPVAMWSRIFRQLAATQGLDTGDGSRMYAMLYLTAADAIISCWDDKAHWRFWRPITAIREAAGDGNPATTADTGWLPLIPTPPYPEHPSGHGCLSSSIVETLRDFFHTDRISFSARSNFSGTTRSFTRFSRAIDEIVDARVYSGIHFRIADVHGAKIGRQVAQWRDHHWFDRVK